MLLIEPEGIEMLRRYSVKTIAGSNPALSFILNRAPMGTRFFIFPTTLLVT